MLDKEMRKKGGCACRPFLYLTHAEVLSVMLVALLINKQHVLVTVMNF